MTVNERSAYASRTLLARDAFVGTDTWETQINNNVLVVGPSGSGKTRGHLMPNVLEMGSSYLVMDVKGSLHEGMGPVLRAHGYRVECLDLTDPARSTVGYDPLDYVRMEDGVPNTLDILDISGIVCPLQKVEDPYWDHAAANMLAACIAFVLEQFPPAEQTFSSALHLADRIDEDDVRRLFLQLEETDPESRAFALGRRVYANASAEKMFASTVGVLQQHVTPLVQEEVMQLFSRPRRIDLSMLGRERSALFVVVDDLDKTLSPLVTVLVGQAIRSLFDLADSLPGRRLAIPVRLMLDDFANLRINDMDDVLAVARSRELWITIICQSVTQLRSIYGEAKAASIIGNCDMQVLLGTRDYETAQYYSAYADVPASNLLHIPLEKEWLFVRGQRARMAEKLDVSEHPLYKELVAGRACPQPTI